MSGEYALLKTGPDNITLNTHEIAALCTKPYPGHPKGCPNFGKKDGCPPKVPHIFDTIQLERPIWLVWNEFNIGAHANRMLNLHPKWSRRQCYCCLYWQGTARKQLRAAIDDFQYSVPDLTAVACPEAQGLNVTACMRNIGIELQWPPKTVAYQVVVIGSLHNYAKEEGKLF